MVRLSNHSRHRDQINLTRESLKQSERALAASEAQAEAAKQSVKIAQETFYIGERPYFGVTGFGLAFTNRVPRVEISFQNGGRTPAWSFYAHVMLALGDDPHSSNRRTLNSVEPHYAMRYFPVGQKYPFVFSKGEAQLSEGEMEDLKNEISSAFVVVTAEYKDMRGEKLSQNFIAVFDYDSHNLSDWES